MGLRAVSSLSQSALNALYVLKAGDTMTGPLSNTGQTTFLARVNSTIADVTGDGTAYDIVFNDEIFDVGASFNPATGVFTAPTTGKYSFTVGVYLAGIVAGTNNLSMTLVTSNRTYRLESSNPNNGAISGEWSRCWSVVAADMDAADTAKVTVAISGGTKVVDVFGNGSSYVTYFNGMKVA